MAMGVVCLISNPVCYIETKKSSITFTILCSFVNYNKGLSTGGVVNENDL